MEYTLRYLPIAKQDLSEAINFILNEYLSYRRKKAEYVIFVRII